MADEMGEGSDKTGIEGIAVLGSHPQTRAQAPFDKPWLIYACSPDNSPHGHGPHAAAPPRVDAWFEVHKPAFDRTRPYEYLLWLKTLHCPIYMRDEVAMALRGPDGELLFPNALAYPEDVIKAEFGPFTFTSSIAYMLAKAIEDCRAQNIARIGLFGIMQASQNEYAYQRPGIQNLIVEACRRGIEVTAPQESRLFEPMPEIF